MTPEAGGWPVVRITRARAAERRASVRISIRTVEFLKSRNPLTTGPVEERERAVGKRDERGTKVGRRRYANDGGYQRTTYCTPIFTET